MDQDDLGHERLVEIIDCMHDVGLNTHEKSFVSSVMGKTYWQLKPYEKARLDRIYLWIRDRNEESDIDE